MDWFHRVASRTSRWVGHPAAFVAAVALLVLWALTGHLFGFSDTWQLVINTTTTIVTFLMVFIIQNTQNREAQATQLKLDELLRAIATARTEMAAVEERSEGEMDHLHEHYIRLAHGEPDDDAEAATSEHAGRERR